MRTAVKLLLTTTLTLGAWAPVAAADADAQEEGTGGRCVPVAERALTRSSPPGACQMQVTATGSEERRGFVLVLHDSSKPAATPVTDWQPQGLCGG